MSLNGDVTIMDGSPDDKVGLVKYDGDFGGFGTIETDADEIDDVAERCEGNGWEYATIHVAADGQIALATEMDDDTPEEHTFVDIAGDHEMAHVDPDLLARFAGRCRSMGWSDVVVHVHNRSLLFAHEPGEDHGVYVALAPYWPEGSDG